MAAASTLAIELRVLRDLFRRYVSSHQRPTIDACRELTTKFSLMAEQADRLQSRADDADEMEAIARDLDIVASATASPQLQAILMREQRAIQACLDAGEIDLGQLLRPVGLAELAMPIGDSNVVTFPRAPRPHRVDWQGDGGDAA